MKKKLFRERWYGKLEEKEEEVKVEEVKEVAAKKEEVKPAKRGRKKND